ncbi:LacI family DNA-binding transcriptional regulator [Rhodoferax aquaticus]|uniref:LacI family DNA-binding transcriptional regulator n=1 Tax=Rhodoferax aquaticus TaxID=2527691 RepID=A0A515EQ42_9BURK|nr:LacI family DNA-binding transcriptional regulator [Rhodoferax aquaticus]QDL54788.1 LacI family DNA-binding transcriptional regulator [Rhodoferax aquaticus]
MGSDATPPASQEPVTLLDVAREAHVSPATVSRILNGTAKVAESKRKAVEDAIARLKFRPNLFARSLKTGITMTVGVLTQSIQSPFYAHALKGIEDGFEASGHASLIVSGHWDAAIELNAVRLLMERRVDGLIILTGSMKDSEVLEVATRLPVVITERKLEGPNVRSIQLDQFHGGYMATQHLLGLGHTRIAHIKGVAGRADSEDRYLGYLKAHQDAKVPVDPVLLVQGDFTDIGGLNAMNQLLDNHIAFTAVFGANDESALGARLALYRRGLHVPNDVSIIGFDDLPSSVFMTPPMTSIRQPTYEVGRYSAHTLLNMMGYPMDEVLVPKLELVVRETTSAVARLKV